MYVYSFVAWNQKYWPIRMIFAITFLSLPHPQLHASLVCLFVCFPFSLLLHYEAAIPRATADTEAIFLLYLPRTTLRFSPPRQGKGF